MGIPTLSGKDPWNTENLPDTQLQALVSHYNLPLDPTAEYNNKYGALSNGSYYTDTVNNLNKYYQNLSTTLNTNTSSGFDVQKNQNLSNQASQHYWNDAMNLAGQQAAINTGQVPFDAQMGINANNGTNPQAQQNYWQNQMSSLGARAQSTVNTPSLQPDALKSPQSSLSSSHIPQEAKDWAESKGYSSQQLRILPSGQVVVDRNLNADGELKTINGVQSYNPGDLQKTQFSSGTISPNYHGPAFVGGGAPSYSGGAWQGGYATPQADAYAAAGNWTPQQQLSQVLSRMNAAPQGNQSGGLDSNGQ